MHFYILSNNEVYEVISRVLASEMVRTSYSFRFEKRESLALNEKTQNTALESKIGVATPRLSLTSMGSKPWLFIQSNAFHTINYWQISQNFTNFTQSQPKQMLLVIACKSCVASQTPRLASFWIRQRNQDSDNFQQGYDFIPIHHKDNNATKVIVPDIKILRVKCPRTVVKWSIPKKLQIISGKT